MLCCFKQYPEFWHCLRVISLILMYLCYFYGISLFTEHFHRHYSLWSSQHPPPSVCVGFFPDDPATPPGLVSDWSAPGAESWPPCSPTRGQQRGGCEDWQWGLLHAAHPTPPLRLCTRASFPQGWFLVSLAVLWGEKAWTKIYFRFLLEEELLSQTTNSSKLRILGLGGNLLRSELSGTSTAFGDFRQS